MTEHKFLDLLPAYAVGALNDEERRMLESHLHEGCEICKPELYLLTDAAATLPYSLPEQALPPGLKEKLRKATGSERSDPTKNRKPFATFLLAAAVLILAVGAWLIWQRLQVSRSTIAAQQQELDRLHKQLQKQSAEIEWLRDPAVQVALLTGLDLAPGARARMIWNPDAQKGMLYVDSVPRLKEDQSYQLWVIGDRGPVSGGVFLPGPSGTAVLQIDKLITPAAGNLQFAVTIEPRGGVPQPTGSMVLKGKPL